MWSRTRPPAPPFDGKPVAIMGAATGQVGTARAQYRGATWEVELAPGEQPTAGDFVIREIHANRLIVAAKPR